MIYTVVEVEGNITGAEYGDEHDTYEDAKAALDQIAAEHPDKQFTIQSWDI